MDNKVVYQFNVNAFEIQSEYYQSDIDDIFIPLLQRLGGLREKAGRRIIVYLAGPCGAGKTTLSLLLESLAPATISYPLQTVGIDGFHYSSAYLSSHYISIDAKQVLMREVKGSAETYDFHKLHRKIIELQHNDTYWPFYDRNLHDTVDDFIFVNGEIVIIEGNWLLLDEPNWKELVKYCDYSLFINSNRETLINRLIERKIRGGLNKDDAKRFVMRSDVKNMDRILNHRMPCKVELYMTDDNRFIEV